MVYANYSKHDFFKLSKKLLGYIITFFIAEKITMMKTAFFEHHWKYTVYAFIMHCYAIIMQNSLNTL